MKPLGLIGGIDWEELSSFLEGSDVTRGIFAKTEIYARRRSSAKLSRPIESGRRPGPKKAARLVVDP